MSLLLTDDTSPGLSDGTMPGFLVEEGEYGKIGNCSDLNYFTSFFIDGPETRDGFVFMNDVDALHFFILVTSVENALYLKNGLC